MPKRIYKHRPQTETTKRKLKYIVKKRWKNPKYRKKHIEQIRQLGLSSKGQHRSPNTEYKKGHKCSNTGKTWLKQGKQSIFWKGDNIKTQQFHVWVKKNKPKSKLCEECEQKGKLELANIKNHRYTRNPKDYKWLCFKCHSKMDFPDGMIGANFKLSKKFKEN
jgi:hypothetical protein